MLVCFLSIRYKIQAAELAMKVKLIALVITGVFLGPIASLVITPIFCFLRKIFIVPFIRKDLLEKAKIDGHVVEAHLQKKHSLGDEPVMREMGTYLYYVNGKKYKYQHITELGLDETIPLYYVKKPRKATVGGDLGNWESPWFKFYLIISLIAAIITVIVGMFCV